MMTSSHNNTKRIEKNRSRDAWLEAGLTLISNFGPQAITIEQLCKVVTRSKGSFYYHFSDVNTFVDELVSFWEQRDTENIMAKVDLSANAWQKRQTLAALALSLDTSTERAIRQWAGSNTNVRARLDKIDQHRITYLANLIEEINDDNNAQTALDLARIEYAAFVGLFYIFPNSQRSDLTRMLRRFLMLMTPTAAALPENWPDA